MRSYDLESDSDSWRQGPGLALCEMGIMMVGISLLIIMV